MPDIYVFEDGTQVPPEEAGKYEVVGSQDLGVSDQNPEASYGDIVKNSLLSFFPETERAAGGLLRLLGSDYGEKLTNDADYIQAYLDSEAPTTPGSVKNYAYRGGQMVSATLPYFLMPEATPAKLAALGATTTLGRTYDSLRDQGTSVLESVGGAAGDAALSYFTSLLPFTQALGDKTLARRVVGTTLGNAAANAVQTAGSTAIDQGITGAQPGEASPGQAAMDSIIPSLISSPFIAAGGALQNRVSRSRQNSRIEDIANKLYADVPTNNGEPLLALPPGQIDLGMQDSGATPLQPDLLSQFNEVKGNPLENSSQVLDIIKNAGLDPNIVDLNAIPNVDTSNTTLNLDPNNANDFAAGLEPPLPKGKYDLSGNLISDPSTDPARFDPVTLINKALEKNQTVAKAVEEAGLKSDAPEKVKLADDSTVTPKIITEPNPPKPIEKPEIYKLDSERGALNIGEVADSVKGMFRFLDPALDPKVKQVETPELVKFFRGEGGLPGIPKKLKAASREYLTQMITFAEKVPEFNRVYQGWNNFTKEYHSGVHQDLAQLDDYLNLSDKTKVNDALFAHRKAQANAKQAIPITPERLMRPDIGMNQAEAKAFFAVRDYFDGTAKEKLKEYLYAHAGRYANPDEVKVKIDEYISNLPPGYVPQVRRGNFEVRSTTGEPYVSYHKTAKEADAEANRLARETGNHYLSQETKKVGQGYYDWMSGDLAGPLSFLSEAAEKGVTGQELPVKGFAGRLQKADLVEGYSKDLSRSIAEYVTGVNRSKALAKQHGEFEGALKDIETRAQTEPNGFGYLEPGNLFDQVKGYIDDIKSPVGRSKAFSEFMFHYALGGNVKSAALNLTQPITVMYPALGQHVKNPMAVARKAYEKALSAQFNHKGFTQNNPELAKAINTAIENGIISGSKYEDAFSLQNPQSEFTKEARNVSGYLQGKTEKFNRLVGFIGGYEAGRIKGLKGEALQKFAEDFNTNVNFGYGAGDRAKLFRKVPELAIFRQFTAQYLRQFWKAARGELGHESMPKIQRQLVGTARLLGPMVGLTGAFGLPMVTSAVKGFEAAGYDPKDKLKELVGDGTTADIIEYGLPMAAGVNLSGSLGLGNLTPDMQVSPVESAGRFVLGAAAQPVVNMTRAAQLIGMGRPERAMEAMLPPGFAANPLKAGRFATEGITNAEGKQIVPPEALSAKDIAFTALGFNTAINTRAQDRERQKYTLQNNYKKASESRNRAITDILYKAGPEAYQAFVQTKSLLPLIKNLSEEDKQALVPLLQELPEGTKLSKFANSAILPRLRDRYDPLVGDYKRTPKAIRPKMVEILKSQIKDTQGALGQ